MKNKKTILIHKLIWGVLSTIVVLLLTIVAFNAFLDINTKITIKCSRNDDICEFIEKKYFFAENSFKIPLNKLKSSKIDIIGCSAGGCRYKIIIKTNDKV